jgi:hypothetical protein
MTGYEATFYVEIAPADYYRNATHLNTRAMRLTLAPPRNPRQGARVIKLVIELPRSAFEPPEVVVRVPASALRGRGRVNGSAVVEQ